MKAHNNLVSLRAKVQHYLDTGEVLEGFERQFGICDNDWFKATDLIKLLMSDWSESNDISGGATYPIDKTFTNYYERRFARWDQSTEWGRNRIALLDWLIIETGKLGI